MRLMLNPALFLLILSSCMREPSDTVSQDSIWAHYEIEYDEDTDISTARAWFRFSNSFGTKLELSEGAEVLFNGEELTWKPTFAIYEKEYIGFIPTANFDYTDLDGITYSNSIDVHTVAFPADLDTVSVWETYQFEWAGDPLWDDESMVLEIENVDLDQEHSWLETGELEDDIVMSVDRLQLVGEGDSFWYLKRTYYPPLSEESSAGGTIEAIYRPERIHVLMD